MLHKTSGSSSSEFVSNNKTVVEDLMSSQRQNQRKQINTRSYVQSKTPKSLKIQGMSTLHTASSIAKQTIAGKRIDRKEESKSRDVKQLRTKGQSHSRRSKT